MFFGESDEHEHSKGGRRVPTVLLGKAGVGKSTLCKHLTDAWANPTNTPWQFTDAKNLQQFKCVFYVSCRFAKEKESILEMIENQLFSRKDESMRHVARYILTHHSASCLILVDGLDEWKGSASSDTGRRDDIQGVPSLEGVEDCVIFITSRPWRFHALPFDTQKECRRLELNGIKNEGDLILHILKHLNDPEPEKSRNEFLIQIKKKNMSELLKTPLMLIIVLDVWRNDKMLHKSLCTNYVNMLISFIRRAEGGWSSADRRLNEAVNYSDMFGVGGVPSSIKLPSCFSVNKLLQRYSGLLVSLGHLACDLLLGKQNQSLVFSKDDCESYLDDEDDEKLAVCLALGVLSKTETTARGIEIVESYSFAHKTFQEYFAALWLATKFADKKMKLYQCVRTINNVFDYSVLIQFLCGLCPEAGTEFWRYVSEEVIDKDEEIKEYRYKPYLVFNKKHKINEIQCLILKTMKEALACCDQQEEQVCYCIPDVFNTGGTSEEDVSLLNDIMQSNTGYMKSLNMEIYLFSVDELNHKICRLVSCATNLQRLELIGMPDYEKSSSDPILDLQKHNKLQVLYLNLLPINGLPICGLLLPRQEESQLQYLELWTLQLSHDSLDQLCSSLSSWPGLRELRLYDLSCSDDRWRCRLSVMDLHKCNRLETLLIGKLPICSLLLPPQEDSQLRDLELRDLVLSHNSLVQLSSSALYIGKLPICGLLLPHQEESQLQYLDLEGLVLSHDYLVQLSSSLSTWSGLRKLRLTELACSDDSGSRCLSVMDLHKCNRLETLLIGKLPICSLLLPPQEDSQLRDLELRDLVLSHNSLVQLSSSLTTWPGLKRLWLDNLSCSNHSESRCHSIVDLKKLKTLGILSLDSLPISSILLPCQEESQLRYLSLTNLVLSHDSIVQLSESVSSLFGLEAMFLTNLSCSNHSGSHCLPIVDLQKTYNLQMLAFEDMSVEGLLSPIQINQKGIRFKDYKLSRVRMPTGNWRMFIEGLASSDETFEVTLKSCNIDSDTRDLISSCPQFRITRNDDELVIFGKCRFGY